MALQAAKQPPSSSPLDRLAALLRDDMLAVNELIIDNMQSDVKLIPQLAGYLIASGGKRIRPLLTLACARLYGCRDERPYGLAASVEFIHTATLLHDDVVDGSEERRGKDAANLVFGNQASVLVGDFLFSRAFQLMVRDGSIEVLRILSEAASTITQGEVMQLTTANDTKTTLEDYIEVISAKTAALFAATCEIGPVIANRPEHATAMRGYGLNLGIAFQIADDVLDYSADQALLGKTVGDDFREGKMTAPVILALKDATDEERVFWQRTIAGKSQTEGDLKTAQNILKRHNALEQSLKLASDYGDKARAALAGAGKSELSSLLDELINFSTRRGH